jgi:hypothetical protein
MIATVILVTVVLATTLHHRAAMVVAADTPETMRQMIEANRQCGGELIFSSLPELWNELQVATIHKRVCRCAMDVRRAWPISGRSFHSELSTHHSLVDS